MSITSYVSDTKEKISLRPSRKAVKRAALALAARSASPVSAILAMTTSLPAATWNRPMTPM